MIRARFRLELAEDLWVTGVSTRVPEATLRLLTGVPMGDRTLELGEVRAECPEVVGEAIRDHPDITAFEAVYADGERAIARYETLEQGLYEFLWEAELPPEFPIVVEDGTLEFEITASQAQFDAFGAALDDTGRRYEVLSVVHTHDDDDPLTDRQLECLRAAHRRGYFDVPRDCTLAEIATEMGVDTSTASETVRRATGRVVDRFFVGRG